MKSLSLFVWGVTAGVWIGIFIVDYRLTIDFDSAKKIKSECEKSLPRDQECVIVYDFVPVKKENQNDPT